MALEPVGDSIWLAAGDIVSFYGFPYPTRSVVIRLTDGDLWIWSPIALTQSLVDEINACGRVRHLVSPNKLHHLYLQEWKSAYPDAALWGPESTVRKRKDLEFQKALTDLPPPAWQGEIDQVWFQGSKAMDEVVFFHRLSSTAIIADLSENFSAEFLLTYWSWPKRVLAKAWKITVPYGYAPLELRWTWFNRKPAREALNRLIAWDPQRVIMAHGEWQRENGKAFIEQAFAWLQQS
ncbi:MAG: DUF4336 domain-containing protein [Gammaproteobacteria bacterium]|nr:DUF4336 domain-containing protein [Gammaproteobacteria bacterium]